MTKRYAFVYFDMMVLAIEDRAACRYTSEKQPGDQWALEELTAPGFLPMFVEITAETGGAQPGMLYSDGKFVENLAAPDTRSSELEDRMGKVEQVQNAYLGTEEE